MTTTPVPVSTPTVRELIAELASTEDTLRECRRGGSVQRQVTVARRQAVIVRELRRRARGGH
ncbi:hypothetical protein H9L10_12995 [Phycicoccus endophyticus]|uniref:50S ribosomal protein L29 n=1 Tax=Phycicoccus endophyticus TaxID=1690220 RepID=A0A7G9R0K9_9MICO|nr:hypothetical protein [Phycicoccus endophyticus]NHI19413.1 hypothetical protein [Phycicoccus endophyticus]QNN49134.1 hypothetical protein H9L10_12995 [Phycicoccus endophyticus]GGL38896.1 hypothetical protein GCM10012283_21820 [Phycicoccus endophyticus]